MLCFSVKYSNKKEKHMQFSLFGVPFKCTKDMFSWKKLGWTMCVYWAQFWRGMVLGLVLLGIVGIVVWQSQFFQIFLEEVLTKGSEQAQHYDRDQIFIDWYHSTNILGWVGAWGALISAAFILSVYIQYYTLAKKHYKSFNKGITLAGLPKRFWSCAFWKRWMLSVLYSLIIGFVFWVLMALVMVVAGAALLLLALIPGVAVASAIIGGVLFVVLYAFYAIGIFVLPTHITLHGGTWGVVPVSKQAAPLEKAAE
jgi:hypothetical protein